ncbi:hypothetical protein NP233_g6402 [Leucocoprinus birnbaumii]|uniref:Uncharacterized protein n=1 Tax=Leucocoprinus birnbaumii TaxID=56174 RepID=A0AAD5VR16_9AGAR|nr:hypothetical protein NP233_g6402 [Leucocoprinus birnbaumii]
MGRYSKNGEPPLEKEQIRALEKLGDDAVAIRESIRNGKSAYKMLQDWVNAVAIPQYNNLSSSIATPYQQKQIYQWYKNYCQRTAPKPKRQPETSATVPSPIPSTEESSGRLRSVRDLVLNNHHDEIHAAARQAHNGTDKFVNVWNKALSDTVDAIPEAERQKYLQMIHEEDKQRKTSPMKAHILVDQGYMIERIAGRVRELLGWERKQFGDATCFLAITYRDTNNKVQEARFMISNHPDSLSSCDPFLARYDEALDGVLSATSGRTLPRHPVESLPLFDNLTGGALCISECIDFDLFTFTELREVVKLFVERTWVARNPSCTSHNVPWDSLCSPEDRKSVLLDPAPFESFSTLNPSQMARLSVLQFLEMVSSSEHRFAFSPSAQTVLFGNTSEGCISDAHDVESGNQPLDASAKITITPIQFHADAPRPGTPSPLSNQTPPPSTPPPSSRHTSPDSQLTSNPPLAGPDDRKDEAQDSSTTPASSPSGRTNPPGPAVFRDITHLANQAPPSIIGSTPPIHLLSIDTAPNDARSTPTPEQAADVTIKLAIKRKSKLPARKSGPSKKTKAAGATLRAAPTRKKVTSKLNTHNPDQENIALSVTEAGVNGGQIKKQVLLPVTRATRSQHGVLKKPVDVNVPLTKKNTALKTKRTCIDDRWYYPDEENQGGVAGDEDDEGASRVQTSNKRRRTK